MDNKQQLVELWQNNLNSEYLEYYGTRDNCGPAAWNFIEWVEVNYQFKFTIARGEFKLDKFVYEKEDFTKEQKQELVQAGYNFNKAKDRKAWVAKSPYVEMMKAIPHYWVEDQQGNIYDPSGFLQFIKSKMANDLSTWRYTKQDPEIAKKLKI